jgi:transcriptional regulator with XRE-family HTH domain
MPQVVTRSQVRDPLALRVGGRIRDARKRAGLTQEALAGDRYTKAYVSALENGLIKPSVKALDYLAGRLNTTPGWLMASETATWTRLEADLELAAGNWQKAADAYGELLEGTSDRLQRAQILRSLAEAHARLDHGAEAVRAASEAVELFEAEGHEVDGALASYWLSAGMYYQDNVPEARAILAAVLGKVRAGLKVEPDFKVRLLMALSSNASREGDHAQALTYLEEVRALANALDDRRRAAFLFDLAYSYTESGDFEAAIRVGYASLALYAASNTTTEMAKVENEMALAHLGSGNTGRAAKLAASAQTRFEQLGDERQLSHVIETQAQIALAKKDWAAALSFSGRSIELARKTDNLHAEAAALLTAARARVAMKEFDEAATTFAAAADAARQLKRPAVLRGVLTEWADLLAAQGDHERAFALSREALETAR